MDKRMCTCGGVFSLCRHRDKAPMRCGACEKDLILMLCGYDKERNYFCEKHCVLPEWQSSHDSFVVCAHCGIERGNYWEGVARGFARQLPNNTTQLGWRNYTSLGTVPAKSAWL